MHDKETVKNRDIGIKRKIDNYFEGTNLLSLEKKKIREVETGSANFLDNSSLIMLVAYMQLNPISHLS